MRKFFVTAALAAFIAAPAMAQMTLVEDFSSYTEGDSLKLVNGWDQVGNTNYNPSTSNPESALVTTDSAGTNLLAISTRDVSTTGGDLELGSATGVAYDIPDIADLGTIYMKFKVDDAINVSIATNGRQEDFCDDNATTPCQGVTGWSDQASINQYEIGTKTGPTYAFRGRDGGAYVDSLTSTFMSDTWYEYWIQLDVDAQIAKYYMRELGDTNAPVAMLDAGGSDEWGFRNTSYSSLTTLKFNISGSPSYLCDEVNGGVDDPAVENCFYQEILIADIGVDATGWSLDSVGSYMPAQPCIDADFNCDGSVGLLDLDILGANWGATGASFAQGDANGDGEVGLLDLDALGANWGNTATPEPATLGLLAIGGLLAIRRR